MNKRLGFLHFKKVLLVLLICLTTSSAFSQNNEPFSINNSPLPAPTGFINDYAGVVDQATKQRLEQRLKTLRDTTNPPVEIGVAIVNTTGERPIFDYSLAVARGWGIGAKADDNPSALLFIAIDDRKYFTQVSKDLEDELPDGLVGQLQRQNLVPAFRQQNYAKGVEDTIEAYIRTIEAKQVGGAPPASGQTEQTPRQRRGDGGFCTLPVCLIILFILFIIIMSRGGRRKDKNDRDRWGGGGGFGGGGGALPWIVGSIIANNLGSGSSSSSQWGSSSSDWGGGSDWGGFGGGGDFGGGGAGGDW